MSAPVDWRERSNFKTQLAREEEQSLQVGRDLKRKEKRVRALLSKKTPPIVRRDDAQDRKIFQLIQGAMASGVPVRLVARRQPAVISNADCIPDEELEPIGCDEEQVVRVPPWDHTTARLKALSWVMVVGASREHARAFSLRLGPAVLASAKRAQEVRSIGHARFLRDQIQKHLTKRLSPLGLACPDFFFWIEADSLTEPHLHGAIVIPEHQRRFAVMRAVRRALKEAGGLDWMPRASQKQLALRRLWEPAGWAGYIAKFELLSKLRIGDDNTVAATRSLRAKGRAWYNNARATGGRI